jgi:hypothetical protein
MGVCIETLVRTGGDTALEIGPGSLESASPDTERLMELSAPVCSLNRTGGKLTTMLFSRERGIHSTNLLGMQAQESAL